MSCMILFCGKWKDSCDLSFLFSLSLPALSMISLAFFRSVELHVPTLLYYTLYLLHCLTLLLDSWIQGTPLIGPSHHSSATELHRQHDSITILSYLILFYPNSPPLLILFSLSNFNSYLIPSSLTPTPTLSHPLSPQHLPLPCPLILGYHFIDIPLLNVPPIRLPTSRRFRQFLTDFEQPRRLLEIEDSK